MKVEYVWVVGGGLNAVPLVEQLHSNGFAVIVSDGNKECACSSLADFFIHASTRNMTETVGAKVPGPVVGVITGGTDVGPTVSLIAHHYKLRACEFSTALSIQNKSSFRKIMKLLRPFFFSIPTEVASSLHGFVMKPSDSWASRGITIFNDEDPFTIAAYKACKETVLGKDIILEERLMLTSEGTTDWIVCGGKPIFLNGTFRVFSMKDPRIQVNYYGPWIPPAPVYELAEKICERFPLLEGPLKMDVGEFEEGKWTIIEAATRWSGGFDATYGLEDSTGMKLNSLLIRYALGEDVSTTKPLKKEDIISYNSGYSPLITEGVLITDSMMEEIQKDKNVIKVIRLKRMSIPVTSCNDRCLMILARGKTPTEAMQNAYNSVNGIESEFRSAYNSPWRSE